MDTDPKESVKGMGSGNKSFFLSCLIFWVGYVFAYGKIDNRNELLFFFDKIEAKGDIDVFVRKGEKRGKISIFADTQIIDSVVARVSRRTLFLDANNSYSFQRRIPFVKINATRKFPVEIMVSVNDLSEIRIYQGANVTCKEFSSSDLKVFHSGSGQVFLDDIHAQKLLFQQVGSGTSILRGNKISDLEVNIEGGGNLKAGNLEINSAKVIHRGIGMVEINPIHWLDARMHSSGPILLYQEPEKMVVEQTGTGEIKFLFQQSER